MKKLTIKQKEIILISNHSDIINDYNDSILKIKESIKSLNSDIYKTKQPNSTELEKLFIKRKRNKLKIKELNQKKASLMAFIKLNH